MWAYNLMVIILHKNVLASDHIVYHIRTVPTVSKNN